MASLKALALSLLAGVAVAHPLASLTDAPMPAHILERAPAATSASGTSASTVSCPGSNSTSFISGGISYMIECGMDRPGDLEMLYTLNFATCIDLCATVPGCVDVSYVSNTNACYFKGSVGTPNYSNSLVWGARALSGSASSTKASTSTTSSAAASSIKVTSTSTTSTTVASSTKASSTSSTSSVKTSTTTTTSHATSTTSTGTSAGKRGLAYNTASYAALFTASPEVSWGYNWGQSSSGLNSQLQYSPQLWCSSSSYTSAWSSNAKAAIAAGAKYLLGFNEPDLSSQCNITPAQAASAWMTYMKPVGASAKLVSPAVTNGGGQMGLVWMQQFLGNCTSCQVDAIALHWYSSSASDLQNHIEQANSMFPNKPIWVTEFGLTGSTDAQIESFLETVMPWMDSTSYVQRYAYFGTFEGYLVNSTGSSLSDYGQVYANYV